VRGEFVSECRRIDTGWGFWLEVDDNVLAGVVRADFHPASVEFVTPNQFGLQVAVMNRPKGYEIAAHDHYPVPRALVGTQEVLLIRRGELRADLYSDRSYAGSVNLNAGDLIILNSGGHGFVASEDCLFVEVKQGPYVEGRDKEVFSSVIEDGIDVRFLD
jgi:hypothetical protein